MKYISWMIGLVVVLVGSVWWQWPSGELAVVFCDVGQGDGVLVQQGFNQLVIDGGNANGRMVGCLSDYMPFWDRHINLVVMSHPQSDHFGGLSEVMDRYEVEVFLGSNAVNQTKEYWDFYQQIVDNADRVVTATAGQRLWVGSVAIDVLWPMGRYELPSIYEVSGNTDNDLMELAAELQEAQPEDVNDASVAVRLSYGNFNGLFTGDVGIEVEEQLVNMYDFSEVELFKVGHHGSKTSSSQELVDALSSLDWAVISVSANNSYGHPHEEVVQRYENSQVELRKTSEVGDVVIRSDGEEWWME